MKVILEHPCGISTYEYFSAIPRQGDRFYYSKEYSARIIKMVCDQYNLKKSYQLVSILFGWTLMRITFIHWVYDEETESYIAKIEMMQALNDEKNACTYPTYFKLHEFISRRNKQLLKIELKNKSL